MYSILYWLQGTQEIKFETKEEALEFAAKIKSIPEMECVYDSHVFEKENTT